MKDPSLLLKTYLTDNITVKLRNTQYIHGTLHAFDEHFNIIITTDMYLNRFLFIRGESITAIGRQL